MNYSEECIVHLLDRVTTSITDPDGGRVAAGWH